MKQNKKTILMLVSLVVLLAAVVGTTIAYLVASDDPITNTFTPTSVPVDIPEDTKTGVKKEVKVKNKGTTDAYIRAMVVITWKDKDGNIYAGLPVEGTDYKITWTKKDWVKFGEYYYYTKSVPADGVTGVLFTDCKPIEETAPADGYSLSVEIIAQSIQAKPDNAIQEAWGVTISDGNVTSATSK